MNNHHHESRFPRPTEDLESQNTKKKKSTLIPPHGGTLVNRIAPKDQQASLLEQARSLPTLNVTQRTLADIECISTGVYSPLTGFLTEKDYLRVIYDMELTNGITWPIPVTLPAPNELASTITTKNRITLAWNGKPIAIMTITDIYEPDKHEEATNVFKTDDLSHPGVATLFESPDTYLGGPIDLINPIPHHDFLEYRLTPLQTREEFQRRGWHTIVAFQTRNPIHRAHEYLQKVALEMADGLFINPLVGTTKSDDVPAKVRMQTYEVILNTYYPRDRVLLGVFPAAMRYAGPREAIMHAIARQNYGCTHFIVGRDHAGVGNYYGTYDAQQIFEELEPEKLLIQPLKFEHAFYCKICEQMATKKTCPHGNQAHVYLSGTKVRKMLADGEMLPREFTRPEVAMILSNAYQQKRDHVHQRGVTVWFTGLSGAGKTTISKALERELRKRGYKVERLDGDIIRQNLTKGLGFSKEDRDENIRRIGFVAQLLTRNNVIVLVAAISPYRHVREEVRQRIGDFIEVYVNAPLEVCEQRDVKGLYKKARAGLIKQFTGIDDPYEPPINPEVECRTDQETVEESVTKVLRKMAELGYIETLIQEP